MHQPIISIASIDEDQLKSLIATAKEWLMFMGPGVSMAIAAAIVDRWHVLGPERVKVILDVDPEVSRLGYGEIEALKILQSASKEVGSVVNHQPGLRIGLLMTDQSTLVFAPRPLLIDGGTIHELQTNAIALDFIPSSLMHELGLGEKGQADQTIGLAQVTPEQIDNVDRDLDQNPPVKFDVARIMNAFNALFEFVEFKLEGTQLSRKSIPIPADLMGLAREEQVQQLLHTNFRLIGKDGKITDNPVKNLKDFIVGHFLISLPGYGNVVLRTNKDKFLRAVKILEKYVRRYQQRVERLLQAEMDANRDALFKAILPTVQRQSPDRWYRYIGAKPTGQEIAEMLDIELKSAFGTAKDITSQMQVKVLFKGVTYELLNTPGFVKTAHTALPTLKVLHNEFRVAHETD